MKIEEIDRAAWDLANGKADYLELPNYVEKSLYHMLYTNYRLFLDGAQKKEASSEIKAALLACTKDELAGRYREAELFKRTEAALAAYRKERTLENADRIAAAIDGMAPKK